MTLFASFYDFRCRIINKSHRIGSDRVSDHDYARPERFHIPAAQCPCELFGCSPFPLRAFFRSPRGFSFCQRKATTAPVFFSRYSDPSLAINIFRFSFSYSQGPLGGTKWKEKSFGPYMHGELDSDITLAGNIFFSFLFC